MGQTRQTNAIPDKEFAPLPLADEPRMETYELMSPAGRVVVCTRNMDDGSESYEWTTRTKLTSDGHP